MLPGYSHKEGIEQRNIRHDLAAEFTEVFRIPFELLPNSSGSSIQSPGTRIELDILV